MTEHADAAAQAVAQVAPAPPPYVTAPPVGIMSVDRTLRSVDFPAPFGPKRPVSSPA